MTSAHNYAVDKRNRVFWQNSIKQARYLMLGLLSVFVLLWQPALPYVYMGALAGVLHFITELAFYRKAQLYYFGLSFFLYMFLIDRAEELYPIKDKFSAAELLFSFMLIGVYFGVRGLLFLIFRRFIVSRVGLDTLQTQS